MSDNAVEHTEEVKIGHLVHVSDGRPRFIGEKVRFKGEMLGHYTAESTVDDSRLKRKDVTLVLYHCPEGYRVLRHETDFRRRRERSRWTAVETVATLLPVNEEDEGTSSNSRDYHVYTEDEARKEYLHLFSALGMPNVREID